MCVRMYLLIASCNGSYFCTRSAYERYNCTKVLEMLELDEPMMANSDDDLELDLGSEVEM